MDTPRRSIRISEELWRKAKEKAQSEGKNISEVIVTYLKDYA
jgi:macrodomain Ter protein organizer (MatP/YcbG family)